MTEWGCSGVRVGCAWGATWSGLVLSRGLGWGVMRFVNLLQAFFHDVGVDLRRGDIGMPQHELDGAQIRSAFQQMGGKTVPQHVGRERNAQSRPAAITGNNFPYAHPAYVAPAAI